MQILLKYSKADGKLPIGASKFFGAPDLPRGFKWPKYRDGRKKKPLDFICQINCEALAPLDTDGAFPKHGLISFFYKLDQTPFELETDRCVYYFEDVSALESGEASSAAQRIEFAENDGETFPAHVMLGEPFLSPFDWEGEAVKELLLLLELDCFETEDRRVSFWDDGTLQFYIAPEKLKRGELDDVKIILQTT